MKKSLIVLFTLVLVLSVCLISTTAFAGVDKDGYFTTRGNEPIPAFGLPSDPAVQAYWNMRHTYEQHEALLKHLADTYPQIVKMYSIGHTWEERTLWCVEISSNGKSDGKTPVALVGNIHGGEHESAEAVAYTAWWLAAGFAAGNADAINALDGYVWYVIPVMNADGYARSMYTNTRQNMRPRGLGMDEYFDRSGNGKVGQMFVGSSATNPPYNGGTPSTSVYAIDVAATAVTDTANNYLGYEAYNTNNTGRFGDSTKQSAIDMNRSFDHFWTLYRPANASSRADGYELLGASGTWNDDPNTRNAGPGPASEPEVQAIQKFFSAKPPVAMITGHTGIQCVLYPWCNTPNPTPDHDFMSTTAEKMRVAYETAVQKVRPNVRFYQMQSYFDYPTSSEMIDWLYGRLGTHAYTVEVYNRGTANATNCVWDDTAWWNANFPARWTYFGQVTNAGSSSSSRTYNNVWIYYNTTTARAGEAPPDQYILGEGFKDCALQMAFSEARYTPHPGAPAWLSGNYEAQSTVADFNIYMESADTNLTVGDTLYVDIMIEGYMNFAMTQTKVKFDTDLLEYAGYNNGAGWMYQVSKEGADVVSVNCVASMNMNIGLPCSTPVKVITLKFTVKDGFAGDSATSDLTFDLATGLPINSVPWALTAPPIPFSVTLNK